MSWFKQKYNSVKAYFNNQDTQQNITVTVNFISDGFKVLMASLLSVFVPQKCEIYVPNIDIFNNTFGSMDWVITLNQNISFTRDINGTTLDEHICTLKENFSDLINFNSFVLAFNFLTLFLFMYLYYIELNREKWLISHFDYDKEKTDEAILSVRVEYPDIHDKLQEKNYKYMCAYKYLAIIYSLNMLFSSVLLFYYYYYDYRTATAFLTNIILCSNKMRVGRLISKESYEKGYAYSFYNTKNISFNKIDARYETITNKDDDTMEETNLDGIPKHQTHKLENLKKQLSSIRRYITTL
jgi:hypothetical protein